MARGINKVILVGNLGQDPETRYMPSGGAVTNFTLATNESWKDKQTGEQKDRTEWHRVAMFGRLAEIAAEYLRKGSQVYVEGKLRTRKWQDRDGHDRYTTEVIADEMQMLGGRGGFEGGGGSAPASRGGSGGDSSPNNPPPMDDFDDDIPFNRHAAGRRSQVDSRMSPKLFIKTMGCQMNEYDSGKMADVLRASHGYELTDKAEEADLLLVNTCSIREKAQEKVFSELGRWRQYKERRAGVMIGVGGCVASQEGEGITARAPYVDLVFGPQTLHRLPELLDGARARGASVVDVSFPEIEKFDRLPEPRADVPTAFVSCMEGCSKYCSFCVVPYTRGEEISRPLDDVIAEIAVLAEQGVREINLLGQNVNAYRGPLHDGGIADLATLIYYVAAVDGIERVRFTTSHPVEFTDSLVQAYAEVPQLASYLHLPVQHGSDRILAAMKRGHTVLEYKSKIRKLREARPGISLSSDFIVGFPGETDRDFEALMNLVADIGFDQSFSFVYSPRPGTPAANLADDTPMAVKKERLQILQARINQQAMAISRGMVGTVQRVLVEKLSRKSDRQVTGRTENMRWVNFDGDASLIGCFVDVLVTEALPNSLRGRLAGDQVAA